PKAGEAIPLDAGGVRRDRTLYENHRFQPRPNRSPGRVAASRRHSPRAAVPRRAFGFRGISAETGNGRQRGRGRLAAGLPRVELVPADPLRSHGGIVTHLVTANFLSEATRPDPAKSVVAWLRASQQRQRLDLKTHQR